MKFLKDHLNFGGSVIFFEIITNAIDDCIHALTTNPDTAKTKDIIEVLKILKIKSIQTSRMISVQGLYLNMRH